MNSRKFWIAAMLLLALVSSLAAKTNLVGAQVIFSILAALSLAIFVYNVCAWIEVLCFGTKAELDLDEKKSTTLPSK